MCHHCHSQSLDIKREEEGIRGWRENVSKQCTHIKHFSTSSVGKGACCVRVILNPWLSHKVRVAVTALQRQEAAWGC